ncbi:hypothetical protein V3C99_010438 [Haemonchus contortus]|uniref:Secreted protein n=1 Tax=Haemonchus contortus TaxID=6289 RepID=A0A7I4YFF0_HAECO
MDCHATVLQKHLVDSVRCMEVIALLLTSVQQRKICVLFFTDWYAFIVREKACIVKMDVERLPASLSQTGLLSDIEKSFPEWFSISVFAHW